MCGIVGYIGQREAKELLLNGLRKLEYRGYDSAGIAVLQQGGLQVKRAVGRLDNLCAAMAGGEMEGTMGIGHTRWATHGAPSVENSHPHCNEAGTIAVVHNGIIENHEELKAFLQGKGYQFQSETDTEVIPHLIDFFYQGDLLEAVQKAAQQLHGSYAVCAIHTAAAGTNRCSAKRQSFDCRTGARGKFYSVRYSGGIKRNKGHLFAGRR